MVVSVLAEIRESSANGVHISLACILTTIFFHELSLALDLAGKIDPTYKFLTNRHGGAFLPKRRYR